MYERRGLPFGSPLICLTLRLAGVCLRGLGGLRFVKSRVERIEVAAVQMFLDGAEGFTKPLEMDDLTFPEEANGIADFRVFDDAEDIVVGGAGFLFCCDLVRTTYKNEENKADHPTPFQ